jgi:hypothetical protein
VIVAGIDPGVNGGVSIVEGGGSYSLRDVWVTPRLADGEIDYLEFSRIFCRLARHGVDHIFIEQVHAIFGASAKSTFNFGQALGAAKMGISNLSQPFPFTQVAPKTWQKEVWSGIAPIIISGSRKVSKKTGKLSKGKVDTKAMSLVASKRLFPGKDFRLKGASGKPLKNPHDGLVDAALIALYGWLFLTRGRS